MKSLQGAVALTVAGVLVLISAQVSSAASATHYYRNCQVTLSNTQSYATTIGSCGSQQVRHQYFNGQTHWTHYVHATNGKSPVAPTVIKSTHRYMAEGISREFTLGRP